MAEVKVAVQSQLDQILAQIKSIDKSVVGLKDSFGKMGDGASEAVEKQTKKTEGFLASLRSVSGRVSDQIRRDFSALVSLESISGALKISEQFKGGVTETIKLSDTIRKLGQSLGIAQGDFSKFQAKMVTGLGEIGLGSDSAANALQGLAGTPVRGQEALMGYAQSSGQLAQISGEKGKEGDIAKGIANVIQAKGGNVNDTKQMGAVAEDLRRVFNQTGKMPSETLRTMQEMFTSMSSDFRKTIGSRGLANLAATAQMAGPNSTKLIEEMLGKNPIARSALNAQGFKGVFSDKGLDVEKFRKASQGVLSRVGGDPRAAAKTLGLSDEAAEGFVRLSESLDRVKAAQDGVNNATGDLNTQQKQTMSLSEAFSASINRVKKTFATPLSAATQGATNMLSSASQSGIGSAAVVAGGGLVAAMLAGGGLRGIGKGLGLGGMLKAKATEAVTGEKVQDVRVVNADEIGGGSGAAGALAGAGGMLGKAGKALGGAGAVAGAGMAGYELGNQLINPLIENNTQGTTAEGFKGNAVERMIFWLEKIANTENYQKIAKANKMMVDLKITQRDLKDSKASSRGGGF